MTDLENKEVDVFLNTRLDLSVLMIGVLSFKVKTPKPNQSNICCLVWPVELDFSLSCPYAGTMMLNRLIIKILQVICQRKEEPAFCN